MPGKSQPSVIPPPSSPPVSSPGLIAGNSSTVPSPNAAYRPNAGSSPDKNPDANTTALPPPNSDNGAVYSAIISPPAGATPNI